MQPNNTPDYITLLVSGIACSLPVVRYNTYTCLVRLPTGHIIKRHLTKHDASLGLDLAA